MFAAESLTDQAVFSFLYLRSGNEDQQQLQWHNRIPMSVSYWSKEVYDYIHEYQQNMTQALHAVSSFRAVCFFLCDVCKQFYSSDVKHNGVFAPACFIHDNFTVGQVRLMGRGKLLLTP